MRSNAFQVVELRLVSVGAFETLPLVVGNVFRSGDDPQVSWIVVAVVVIDVVDVETVWHFGDPVCVHPHFFVESLVPALLVPDAGGEVSAVGFVSGVRVAAEPDSSEGDNFDVCHTNTISEYRSASARTHPLFSVQNG